MIGIFDSGVGGLSVQKEIRALLPRVDIVYLADTKNFPYGEKGSAEIHKISIHNTELLMKHQPEAIVVACNTASTVALEQLREKFSPVKFIGVVPAIKPAISLTASGSIAVLATKSTLESEAYKKLKRQFGDDTVVIDQACPGWVELVESGEITGIKAEQMVSEVIKPLTEKGIDTFVLGCTHYPFLIPLITKIVEPTVRVLDSGKAVAIQVDRVIREKSEGSVDRFIYTGKKATTSSVASRLMMSSVEFVLP